jgi:hypothetical protein
VQGAQGGNQEGVSADLLAHMLLASIIEVAMVIVRSNTPRKAMATGEDALDRLLSSLLRT